jgi:CRISPR-associated endonuclease Csn1
MKKILGLDLGTNSIGWALIENETKKNEGNILGLGTRIIPMSQDILGKFDSGVSISQTAERTGYRSIRRLYQRDNLRRERLHRVLNVLGFLPVHYKEAIDFENKLGQFKEGTEVKLNYAKNSSNDFEFIFKDSFDEMADEFKKKNLEAKIPFDWTIYFLRKKALTKKITKEELAWIILNFNQKRGYYQLRGEEEEIADNKKKEFVVLDVKGVIDTGEIIKKTGDKLYEVVFSNGWKYDKAVVKTENWIGKQKEFIVTSTTKKDGEIKRTYKAVDSEQDWLAIKSKTQQDIDKSNKTVGEYIFDHLLNDPTQKIRGKLVKTIERKYYKEELRTILRKQIELHPELQLTENYVACLDELYARNEAHKANVKNKGFEYLFLEDIIFYQRPLKSKKSTIGVCQYETKTYKFKNQETGGVETKQEGLKAISKSNPLFQEFRLWQFLKNLKVYQKESLIKGKTQLDVDCTNSFFKTEADWVNLFDFLNDREKVDQSQFLKYLSDSKLIPKQNKDNPDYRWNYVEDKSYPCNETRAALINRLKKVDGFDLDLTANRSFEYNLWHIIYSVTDKLEFEKALNTFAHKNDLDSITFVEHFKKIPPFKSDFGSYSEKAIKKLLPLMRLGKYWREEAISEETKNRVSSIIERLEAIGFNKEKLNHVQDDDIPNRLLKSFISFQHVSPLKGLNTYQACYAVYNRHSEVAGITEWKTPEDIDLFLKEFKQHSLRNPIVEQVVAETLRVVRDIWKKHGNSNELLFDEIHVELGREMKNSAKQRKSISDKNSENENTNIRVKEILKEMMSDPSTEGDVRSFSPSHQELLKIYEEGIYQNSTASFNKVSEDEIEKIRRSSNPSKTEITRYKLWLEQGYNSPYTGAIIPLNKLFTTAYQVEHIIPQSRYFDNSMGNKVICESDVNQDKGNKTAYEYLKEKEGSIIEGHKLFKLADYEIHCNSYFKKNRTKLKNLLSDEIPEGFINRQLNDSRYISKLIKGLLSNLVRQENEQEATSKNLIPVTGAITSKLKQDWGLNEKWNELIVPRFKRMNEISNSTDFGFEDDFKLNGKATGKTFFRIQVPQEIEKGFNKKRIDHRHHALDALVVACVSRSHTHYLNALNAEKENFSLRESLLIKNEHGHFTKTFKMPWPNFVNDAKNQLERTLISFKQNNRVINKTNNKTWQWVNVDGKLKKRLVPQTKGDNWAVRKPVHKETVSGVIDMDVPKGKVATASRVALNDIKNQKHIDKIADKAIHTILTNHLKNFTDEKGKPDFESAFSSEGIDALNKNIKTLNNGKKHQPILKTRLFEIGVKFAVGRSGNNPKKYVEAAKGTNLFFAIYWDEAKQKRVFNTVPLNEVVEHQKQVAHLPKTERSPIPIDQSLGDYKFTLSPNDLVFVPTGDEMAFPHLVDFDKLTADQVDRVYKMVSSSGSQCFFVQSHAAKSIHNKVEFSALNKMERDLNGNMIKEICWKLNVDRLGSVTSINR